MLRLKKDGGWVLITHPAHGKLAGDFAAAWGNESFVRPDPIGPVNYGVAHHDDAWEERDATPFITREGLPSAFSKELVGTYDSFEEIDMEDYLAVRGRAASKVAAHSVYAAILVSMHTHNLLTEHVDRKTLIGNQSTVLDSFLAAQTERREAWIREAESAADLAIYATESHLQHAFEFLQGCDSLSLITCVGYAGEIDLQHEHRLNDGSSTAIRCQHLGEHRFRLSPFPFSGDEQRFSVPYRFVPGDAFSSLEDFRSAWRAADESLLEITIVG